MKGLDLIIAGGRVVTSTEVVDAAVGVRDGRIVAIAPAELLPPAARTIDATGKIVFPGAIDCHVHLAAAMELIAAHGGLCQLHCESGEIISWLEDKALKAGRVHPRDFPATCPDWTEEEAIDRAILIGRMTGCPVYVVHLSTRVGLERIKQAQATGQRVWTETCPQYLLLSEDEMEKWGPLAKIGPPLRPAGGPDREALWGGLAQ